MNPINQNIHATFAEYCAATKQVLNTPEFNRIVKKTEALCDKCRKIEKRERAASERRYRIATAMNLARQSGCYSDVTGPLEAKKAELDRKVESLRFKHADAREEYLRYLDGQIELRKDLLTAAGLPLAWHFKIVTPLAR